MSWTILRAAAISLGVAGCAAGGASAPGGLLGADVISRVFQTPTYTIADVSGAAAGGGAIVILDPPGGDAAAVAERLRLPGWFPPSRFQATANPGAAGFADGDYFVLKFNAGSGVDGAGLCSGRVASGGPSGAAHLALCDDGAVIAEGRLSSANLADPANPAFARSMRRFFAVVFPTRLRDNPSNKNQCATADC